MTDIFLPQAFIWGIVAVVLLGLILLVVISSRLGKLVSKLTSDEEDYGSSVPSLASNILAVSAQPANSGISGEVVAAISAAVAMLEGEGAVVQSITPAGRKASARRRVGPGEWGFSARQELTVPF